MGRRESGALSNYPKKKDQPYQQQQNQQQLQKQ
jgi:hypothetical protein